MRSVVVLSAFLVSSSVFALEAPVDYEDCQSSLMQMGFRLDDKGEIDQRPTPGLPAPDIKTTALPDGSRMTYTYKIPVPNGVPTTVELSLEKDKAGKLTKIITGSQHIDPKQVKDMQNMIVERSVFAGVPMGGLAPDPIVTVGDNPSNFQYKTISQLEKEDAKGFGYTIERWRRLRKEKKKDKKQVNKLKKEFSKFFDKASVMIPNGAETEVEIKDGSCRINQVSSRLYNSKAKLNHKMNPISRKRCDEVSKIYKKYEKQIQSCVNTNMELSKELGGNHYLSLSSGSPMGYQAPLIGMGGAMGINGVGMRRDGVSSAPGSEYFACKTYFGERPENGYEETAAPVPVVNRVEGNSARGQ